MYRCSLPALTAACVLTCTVAYGQPVQRNFPQTALRGSLVIETPSDASLNGRPARLAPGVRIRGQDNMLQMSGSLIGSRLVVNYTQEPDGLLNAVWILTPQEAAMSPWPTSAAEARAWQFDPVAQAWSKP